MTITLHFTAKAANGTIVNADTTPVVASVTDTSTGDVLVTDAPCTRIDTGRYTYILSGAVAGRTYFYVIRATIQGIERLYHYVEYPTAQATPSPTDTPPDPPEISLDEIKLYLRIDNTVDDDLIDGLILAAGEFIRAEANLPTCDWSMPTVRLAAKLLIGHWYANREAVSDRRMDELPLGLQRIINQIRAVPAV